jgi:putative addiction module component (TIGR02574 family)
MNASARQEILTLPVSERLQLIEDIWESIASQPADVPVTPEQRKELDKRLANFERDPSAGEKWDDVKSRVTRRK